MGEDRDDRIDPAASGILRRHFGVNWRWWRSFRRQWTLTSALTLVGSLGATVGFLGGWAISLKTRVVVLETRVEPVLNEARQESQNALNIQNLERRVGRIESNLDLDYNEAVKAALINGWPPPPRKEATVKPGKRR